MAWLFIPKAAAAAIAVTLKVVRIFAPNIVSLGLN
jgi:hypothetical protein